MEEETGVAAPKGEFGRNLFGWAVTALALYGLMLGIGALLFHQWKLAIVYLIVAAVAGFFLKRMLSKSAFAGLEDNKI